MIYVHVPFCRSFCTYCDFYSELACRGKDEELIDRYLCGIESETVSRKDSILLTLETNTLYIGGGTPSVLPSSAFRRIVDALAGIGVDTGFGEFTVEVNPEDIVGRGESYVRELTEMGVNRISMGVQSFDDGILKWMNRRHDARCAAEAFRILRKCGVRNISLDIIFGVEGMTGETLRDTVEEMLSWGPEHLSAYQLSVEDGSSLAEMVETGRYVEADEEQCRRQYDFLCERLRRAGFEHYEISNWARPGARAAHNSAYWLRKQYVGLGPGAHSLIGRRRSWNSCVLQGWTSEGEDLSDAQIQEERKMLGLRTAEGVDGMAIPEDKWFVSDGIIAELI
ncbi:MAG: radical SAM family heme chaperone HemW [Bacteroidales bacterium]|nr:radical SAM family heme chaperone HemW [Bacteroidales bacterium]